MAKPFARLVALLTPKRSWSQFSVRTLLVVTAVICVLLGSLRLVEAFGQRIEVDDVVMGEPIKVKARYVRVCGPPVCTVQVKLYNKKSYYDRMTWGQASRVWLCSYNFQCTFPAVETPGELSIELVERIPLPANSESLGRIKVVKRRTVDVK
jgi:hypothetical protein